MSIKMTSLMMGMIVLSMTSLFVGVFMSDLFSKWRVTDRTGGDISELNFIKNITGKGGEIHNALTEESTESTKEEQYYSISNQAARALGMLYGVFDMITSMMVYIGKNLVTGLPQWLWDGIFASLLVVFAAAIISIIMKRDV